MVIQYRRRFLFLIYTLCYTAIIHGILLDTNDAEICDLLCEQCNGSAIFSNNYCECNFTDDNDKGMACVQRLQREIQTIDLNVLSDDLTDEERNVRSILKSRRRLRMGDADKVAQYFINGGPSTGHSHFYNAAYDSADSTVNSFSGVPDESNPENEFHDVSPHVSLLRPISWSTCNPPLYVIPEAERHEEPATPGAGGRSSILDAINSVLGYPIDQYDLISPLLGSVAYPYGQRSPHHHTFSRTAALPSQFLQDLFAHRLSNRYPGYYGGIVRSANPLQDSLPFVDTSYKNDDDAALYDSSTARNNVDKFAAYNVASSIHGSDFPAQSTQSLKMPHIFGPDTIRQPMLYRYFDSPNSQYAYHNPLINVLYPWDGYLFQPVSHLQGMPSQPISAPNPTLYANNVNSEQSDILLTTDKTVNTDDKTKGLYNIITNSISREERKEENNEGKV